MFNYASSYNGDLSRWDVSNVTNMQVRRSPPLACQAACSLAPPAAIAARSHAPRARPRARALALAGAWQAELS